MTKPATKIAVTTAALLALAATVGVEARPSSHKELRGYANCVDAADAQSNGLVPARKYLVEKQPEAMYYFVNATRWEEGERNHVRISCETTTNGRKLLNASIENGRFDTNSTRVRVEVAQK